MSLWCGNCRTEIFEGFGLLYKLERDGEGKLRLPNQAADYVPSNSAICDVCWGKLPEQAKQEMRAPEVGEVFAYVQADSNNDAFWGSKTWSGIQTDDSKLVFLLPEIAAFYFSQALEIITPPPRQPPAFSNS